MKRATDSTDQVGPTGSAIRNMILELLHRESMREDDLVKRVAVGVISARTARQVMNRMRGEELIAVRWGKLRLMPRGLQRLPSAAPAPMMRTYVPPPAPRRRPGSSVAHIPSLFAEQRVAWRQPC